MTTKIERIGKEVSLDSIDFRSADDTMRDVNRPLESAMRDIIEAAKALDKHGGIEGIAKAYAKEALEVALEEDTFAKLEVRDNALRASVDASPLFRFSIDIDEAVDFYVDGIDGEDVPEAREIADKLQSLSDLIRARIDALE